MAQLMATGAGTRSRLIAAVEELLLTSSYDDVSVRAVCAHAGVNPAAVHYHFGSKDELVVALLQDRLAPLWGERLQELADSGVLDIEIYLEAIVGPLRDLAHDPVGQVRLHLLNRMMFSSAPQQWTGEWFALEPFMQLLRRARPEVGADEAARRWVFAFRLILLEFGNPVSRRTPPSEAGVRQMVRFVAAGLTAAADPT